MTLTNSLVGEFHRYIIHIAGLFITLHLGHLPSFIVSVLYAVLYISCLKLFVVKGNLTFFYLSNSIQYLNAKQKKHITLFPIHNLMAF